jgi:hypothetical protein
MNRREALYAMGIGLAGAAPMSPLSTVSQVVSQGVSQIDGTHSIFFEPCAYGAIGDGKALDSMAINAAIDACHQTGGGIVYLRPGTYLSGTVVLKSNVTLYLEAGATILGSKSIRDYTPQPGPDPAGDAGQNHLIFARDADNILLAGPGKIDGQGKSFWAPSGRPAPMSEDLWKDVATYDWKPLDRASPMMEFVGCQNFHMQGLRIENSAGWTMRFINCNRVFIQRIAVKNPIFGPNSDGMDISNSQNVFISDCLLEVADDVICLKSENPYGDRVPLTKNIVITNCVLSSCCNGLKFGTMTKGGFENITFSNSVIFNDDVRLSERVIAGIALEMVDGGWIEGVNITGIRMQRVRTPIFIRRGNRTPRPDGTPGTLRGVMIDGVHATGAILTSSITGLPGFPVEGITLSNIRIDSEERGKEQWATLNVPEQAEKYPEARMFGRLPSFGLYCRHVHGLHMRDVVLGAAAGEARPAIVCDDARQVEIAGLRSPKVAGQQPVIRLIQSKDVWIRDAQAPEGASSLVELKGNETNNVLLSGCDLRHADKPISTSHDVPANAAALSGNILREPYKG